MPARWRAEKKLEIKSLQKQGGRQVISCYAPFALGYPACGQRCLRRLGVPHYFDWLGSGCQ